MKKAIRLLIILIVLTIIGIGLEYYFKDSSTNRTLRELGYTETAITIMINQGIDDDLATKAYDSFLASLIELPNFDYSRYDRYQALSTSGLTPSEIITMVNNDDDLATNFKIKLQLMKETYYIPAYIDRYLAYYDQNQTLSAKTIVTNVNVNLDYDYYTNTEATDTSKGITLITNKHYYLGNYVPSDLVSLGTYSSAYLSKEAATHFIEMADEMVKLGYTVKVHSAYRSYQTQKSLYNGYVSNKGLAYAEKWSARPGYSEHQTGLALDFTSKTSTFDTFQDTKEYAWLQANSYKYGFILRYPNNQKAITGYDFEPWHYRYVGITVATAIHDTGLTFDEYYEYYIKNGLE